MCASVINDIHERIGIMIKLDTDAGGPGIGKNPLLGDFFVIIGCICYSVSNVLQEYIVKIRPVYETIALIGTFGTIINGIQM
ncbi:Solute carrier family 35 member F2 [Zancudomyces culisetae]|uniref:Solute carrier family 35 member F2 n=1 Tax=Zancudomyces culisetae TaxID=1213189 RepID=A0A1R1PR07_ZANCU|nr:Solute carrier family 35 member F2 [Zancudomyces culisetae]|eukprot:OMH83416.1 Solute carrier family 35 member F2 [Zancudomyces culisetae]